MFQNGKLRCGTGKKLPGTLLHYLTHAFEEHGITTGQPLPSCKLKIKVMKPFSVFLIFTIASLGLQAQNIESIGKDKTFRISSGFNLQTNFYSASGIGPRQPGFSWFASGTPVLSVAGVDLPFAFIFSDQHSGFQQPFNQFGLSPYYKWAKIYLGYGMMRFSPYTLNGHRFLGVGVDINPGKLRFGAMYGRFRKAIVEDPSAIPQPGQFLSSVPVPSYKRIGYSFKLGFGTQKSYIDFIYLKGEDKPNSIPLPQETLVLPEENAVFGISTQVQFLKKITWKADIGISAYTRNQLSDTIEYNVTFPLKSLLTSILMPRESTQLTAAGEMSIGYMDRNFSLRVQYRRVDPEYRSMGAYYFQRDVEEYTISPSVGFAKNKVRLRGTLGFQHDNIYETKALTGKRFIGSGNLALNPNRTFGLNINYTNFGITQTPLTVSISDTTALEQISQSLTVMPRLMFAGQEYIHTFSVMGSYNELSDRSQTVLYNAGMTALGLNLTYNLNWLPKRFNLTTTFFIRDVEISAGNTSTTGLNTNISEGFFEGKLTTAIGFGYFNNKFNGMGNGNTKRVNALLGWNITPKHRLSLQGLWIKNKSLNDQASKSFSEYYGTVSYSFNF